MLTSYSSHHNFAFSAHFIMHYFRFTMPKKVLHFLHKFIVCLCVTKRATRTFYAAKLVNVVINLRLNCLTVVSKLARIWSVPYNLLNVGLYYSLVSPVYIRLHMLPQKEMFTQLASFKKKLCVFHLLILRKVHIRTCYIKTIVVCGNIKCLNEINVLKLKKI